MALGLINLSLHREWSNSKWEKIIDTKKERVARKKGLHSSQLNWLVAELRRAKHASGAPWVTFFGKSIYARNFGYDFTYVRPPVQTVGVEVGRQDSLWGREYSGNFPWREIAWQRCIWQPAFSWREIILVTSKEQERVREKRRRNLRNSRENPRKEKKRKFQWNQRKAERNRTRGKTLIYNG